MAYVFSQEEIDQLVAARLECPEDSVRPTSTGNWAPLYTRMSEILGAKISSGSVSGSDLQDLENAKLWLDVAIGANGNTGIHSTFIRSYTNRQGLLRIGREFTDAEMQYSSNGVAFNLWSDLSGASGNIAWRLPSISEIARADASSIGVNLFGSGSLIPQLLDSNDTAITANAGWSGTVGFNLLGGSPPYESWRLLTAGDSGAPTSATLNTLDDIKNVLFAYDSYVHAIKASVRDGQFNIQSLDAQIQISLSSNVWLPCLAWVLSSTPEVLALVELIDLVGPNQALDMIKGSMSGQSTFGETTDENFTSNAYEFFSSFSAEEIQSASAIQMTSVNELIAMAASDRRALVALSGASLFIVDVKDEVLDQFELYDESTGIGNITDGWIKDRAAMIGALMEDAESSPDLSRIDKFVDWNSDRTYLNPFFESPEGALTVHFGTNDSDYIIVGQTGSRIYGLGGDDTIRGGVESDAIEGGEGNDTIFGGGGLDVLYGGGGRDELQGGDEADFLRGGAGNDSLYGNIASDNNDLFTDYLYGGQGYDEYEAGRGDVIYDEDGKGTIQFLGSHLKGGALDTESASPIYRSDNGNFIYELQGTTLVVNNSLTIEDFHDGDLGIVLTGDSDSPTNSAPPTPPVGGYDPLVLDLDGDGVETININQGVYFDFDNSGFKESTSWLKGEDGFLVWDRNGNGVIDSGRELFGSDTLLQDGSRAPNGFLALTELDSNQDGVIDELDAQFSSLSVWSDKNQNGVSESGEVGSLSSHEIRSISLDYLTSNHLDQNNVGHFEIGSYTTTTGEEGVATNLWFDVNSSETIPVENVEGGEVGQDIKLLPNSKGYGNVHSLHEAMRRDSSGQLRMLVEAFLASKNYTVRSDLANEILLKWSGQENVDPSTAIAGMPGVNAQKVRVLEAFWGQEVSIANPQAFSTALDRTYNGLLDSLYYDLSKDGEFGWLLDLVKFTKDIVGNLHADFSAAIPALIDFVSTYKVDDAQRIVSELLRMYRGANAYASDFSEQFARELRSSISTYPSHRLHELASAFESVGWSGTTEGDVFGGTNTDDLILGKEGDDDLRGRFGDDILVGGSGNDVLDGGAGNDTYIFEQGDGRDTINNSRSSADVDRIVFGDSIRPSDVSLTQTSNGDLIVGISLTDSITIKNYFGSVSGVISYSVDEILFSDGTVWTVDIIKSMLLATSGYDDEIYGFSDAEVIDGGAGDDYINGRNGNDSLYGGVGNDYLSGSEGSDYLAGGDGDDILGNYAGEAGNDIIVGGKGNDELRGGDGDDIYVYRRGDGTDTIRGDIVGANKILLIGYTEDELKFSLERNNWYGTTDLIISSGGKTLVNFIDPTLSFWNLPSVLLDNGDILDPDEVLRKTLLPTDDGDYIYIPYANEVHRGLMGNDFIYGSSGNDTIFGDDGRDTIEAGSGDDTIFGGAGADTIYLGNGSDIAHGGSGNDLIVGDADDTVMYDRESQYDILIDVGTLIFDESIGADDVTYYRNELDLILLVDKGVSGAVSINSYFGNGPSNIIFENGDDSPSVFSELGYYSNPEIFSSHRSHISYVTSVGGNSWGWERLAGTEDDDFLVADYTGAADIVGRWINAGAGNDYLLSGRGYDALEGGGGSDTYIFEHGFGVDVLNEISSSSDVDRIVFGEGIEPEDIVFGSANHGIALYSQVSKDAIAFGNIHEIEFIEFSNGTVWDQEMIQSKIDGLQFLANSVTSYYWTFSESISGSDDSDVLIGMAYDGNVISAGGGMTRSFF